MGYQHHHNMTCWLMANLVERLALLNEYSQVLLIFSYKICKHFLSTMTIWTNHIGHYYSFLFKSVDLMRDKHRWKGFERFFCTPLSSIFIKYQESKGGLIKCEMIHFFKKFSLKKLVKKLSNYQMIMTYRISIAKWLPGEICLVQQVNQANSARNDEMFFKKIIIKY